jgi:hypothetical protein
MVDSLVCTPKILTRNEPQVARNAERAAGIARNAGRADGIVRNAERAAGIACNAERAVGIARNATNALSSPLTGATNRRGEFECTANENACPPRPQNK